MESKNQMVFNVPEGTDTVTVQMEGDNKVLLLFSPKEKFENGDVVCYGSGKDLWIMLYEHLNPDSSHKTHCILRDDNKLCFNIRLETERGLRKAATDEENRFFKALFDLGYFFNRNTLQIESMFEKGDVIVCQDGITAIVTDSVRTCSTIDIVYVARTEKGLAIIKGVTPREKLRIANQSEKDKLFNTIKKAGYRFDKNTLEIEPRFKKGDVIVTASNYVAIVTDENPINGTIRIDGISSCKLSSWMYDSPTVRFANPEERVSFFKSLEQIGYRWNAEALKLEKIKWVPKEGETYWTTDGSEAFEDTHEGYNIDKARVKNNLVFKTKEEAEAFFEKVLELAKNRE